MSHEEKEGWAYEEYKVTYSEPVLASLRNSIFPRARQAGLGREALAALKEIDRRLRVYPEFGEPLYHSDNENAIIYAMSVPPLSVLYGVDKLRRFVHRSRSFRLMLPREK